MLRPSLPNRQSTFNAVQTAIAQVREDQAQAARRERPAAVNAQKGELSTAQLSDGPQRPATRQAARVRSLRAASVTLSAVATAAWNPCATLRQGAHTAGL